MRITVDTEKKSIIVWERASIKEVMDFLESALPDSYKEYTIESTVLVEQVDKLVTPSIFPPSIYPTVRPWGTEIIY